MKKIILASMLLFSQFLFASETRLRDMSIFTQLNHQKVIRYLQKQKQNLNQPKWFPHFNEELLKEIRIPVYMFNKISSLNLNDALESSPSLLGPALKFDIVFRRSEKCSKYSDRILSRQCTVVEVLASDLIAKRPRNMWSKGDWISVKLLMDESYGVYYYDIEKMTASSQSEVQRVWHDPQVATSSGLNLFPLELPAKLDWNQELHEIDLSNILNSKIDAQALRSIKKINPQFISKKCDGYIIIYNDAYGQVTHVGWCKGDPWPLFTENNHYFSISDI